MKKKTMPHDFWNHGINPILGYRYTPDGKSKPHHLRNNYQNAITKEKTN
jgi:hypothetical protein